MTIKLSELREGTMINHNGEVLHSHRVIEMVKEGQIMSPMYLITKEWTADILSQAYNDKSDDTESYSAPNKGELIENDVVKTKGRVILTHEGVKKLTKELETVKLIRLPAAKEELKKWKSYGDSTCIKESKNAVNFLNQRIDVLENMLFTAEIIEKEVYPTVWAYEQACKALHFHEEMSKISFLALNKAFVQVEDEKYDTPKQLKDTREILSKAINAVTDLKIEFSKQEKLVRCESCRLELNDDNCKINLNICDQCDNDLRAEIQDRNAY